MSKNNCVYHDCKISQSGDLFDGEFIDGHPYGKCKIEYVNGVKYNGYVVYGIPNGFGSFFYPDGMTYKGDIYDGKKHGKGKLYFEKGSFYEGNFIDDVASGYGKIIYSSGKKYMGEFLNGLPNGYGKFMFINKNIYEGYVLNGMMHGKGKIIDSSGIIIYNGDFENNSINGIGKCNIPNKYIYEGTMKDNFPNGYGKYSYPNGTYFEGFVVDNKKQGYGKQSNLDGTLYIGFFENDQKNGKGTIIDDVNSSTYVGFFKNNDFSDYGFMKYSNKSIYKVIFSESIFKNDGLHENTKNNDDDLSVINLFEEMGPNSVFENVSNYKNKNRLPIFEEICKQQTSNILYPPPGLGFDKTYSFRDCLNVDTLYLSDVLGVTKKRNIPNDNITLVPDISYEITRPFIVPNNGIICDEETIDSGETESGQILLNNDEKLENKKSRKFYHRKKNVKNSHITK